MSMGSLLTAPLCFAARHFKSVARSVRWSATVALWLWRPAGVASHCAQAARMRAFLLSPRAHPCVRRPFRYEGKGDDVNPCEGSGEGSVVSLAWDEHLTQLLYAGTSDGRVAVYNTKARTRRTDAGRHKNETRMVTLCKEVASTAGAHYLSAPCLIRCASPPTLIHR